MMMMVVVVVAVAFSNAVVTTFFPVVASDHLWTIFCAVPCFAYHTILDSWPLTAAAVPSML